MQWRLPLGAPPLLHATQTFQGVTGLQAQQLLQYYGDYRLRGAATATNSAKLSE